MQINASQNMQQHNLYTAQLRAPEHNISHLTTTAYRLFITDIAQLVGYPYSCAY